MCSTCLYWPHGLLIDNDINFLVICWTFQSVFGLTVIGWTLNIPVIYGLTVITGNWTFQSMVNFSSSSHLLDFPVIWWTCQSFVGLSVICYNFEGSSHLLDFLVIWLTCQSFVGLSVICYIFECSSHLLNFSVIYKIRECSWPRPQVQRSPQGQEPQGVPEVHELPPVPHRQTIWFGGNHGGGRYHIHPETLQRLWVSVEGDKFFCHSNIHRTLMLILINSITAS